MSPDPVLCSYGSAVFPGDLGNKGRIIWRALTAQPYKCTLVYLVSLFRNKKLQ